MSTPALQLIDQRLIITDTHQSFSIPDQWSEALNYLSKSLYHFASSNPQSTHNWGLLIGIASKCGLTQGDESWVLTLLADQLPRFTVQELCTWSNTLRIARLPQTADLLMSKANTTHDAQIAAKSESIESVSKRLIAMATTAFNTRASQPGEPLTAVKLNDQTCAAIISKLGVSYDLFKMIEGDVRLKAQKAYELNELILHTVTALGGNAHIKISKNALIKLLKGKAIQSLAWLKSSFRDPKATASLDALINKRSKDRDLSIVAEAMLDGLLSKGELMETKLILSKPIPTTKASLDPWQSAMIGHIKEGSSVLVVGPTSGGKTFVSMAALDWIFGSRKECSLVYLAPTFHLALQTYANITKTFPGKSVSLVTGVINSIASSTDAGSIWVGTPEALWTVSEATNISFTIGIFDEIHTISGTSTRAYAMANLLGKCTGQVIGLSATVSDTDADRLRDFLSERTGIADVKSIIYRERTIPLKEYCYSASEIVPIHSEIKSQSTDSASTFHLLQQMRAKDRFPTILFDKTDAECYRQFTAFINHCEREEEREYSEWHTINSACEDPIRKANAELAELEASFQNTRQQQHCDRALKIKSDLQSQLCKYFKSESPEIQHEIRMMESAWNQPHGQEFLSIPIPCAGVGPKYRFSEQSSEFDNFRKMRIAPQTNEDRKIHKLMETLTAAERLDETDIQTHLRLIEKSLSYGCGIILPTMPFVIQYEMIRLLHSKRLNVVFASQSMSMGINYPLRSVIIRNPELGPIDVCTGMQMAGRCGRRRLDTEAHVVYWNISNAKELNSDHLKPIVFPDISKPELGSLIHNPLEIALQIEMSRGVVGSDSNSHIAAVVQPITFALHNPIDNSEQIATLKAAVQELHTRYFQCSNREWLIYVERVYELLHASGHQ